VVPTLGSIESKKQSLSPNQTKKKRSIVERPNVAGRNWKKGGKGEQGEIKLGENTENRKGRKKGQNGHRLKK